MEKDNHCNRSIVEQIYDEFIVNIEGQDDFNAEMIENIKEFITKGEIKKSEKVAEAISLAVSR